MRVLTLVSCHRHSPPPQAQRMLLPVNGMEQEIVDAIVASPVEAPEPAAGPAAGAKVNPLPAATPEGRGEGFMADVVVLCGETGSGKSTQVPWYCSLANARALNGSQ